MNPRHHRSLHGLALLAILLLAMVPTLGRLAGSVPGEAAASVAHQMGHHPMASHMPGMAHAAGDRAAPPHHRHDDDCAYCVLLGSAVPTVTLALALPATPLPVFAMPPWTVRPQRSLPRGRLGSRGPPPAA